MPTEKSGVTPLEGLDILGPNPLVGLSPGDILETMQRIAGGVLRSPQSALNREMEFVGALLSILTGTAEIEAQKGDKRFADPIWSQNPFYRMSMQTYLAWSRTMEGFARDIGPDRAAQRRAQFVMSLLTEASAPTNTLPGNPAALKAALESGGLSLANGLCNLLNDLTTNNAMPAQVDKSKFEVGGNLALSPGAVVWRNEVLELIQYIPQTTEVYARPHLIVPPQINKFYVFDLAPGKSIVEHLLKHGFQTFIVSWRNPTVEQRKWNMETYVSSLLDAIEAVRAITGSDDVNLHAACSGAITISALLGYLGAKKQKLVHAVSMMVAVLAPENESLLSAFASKETIAAARMASAAKGVLEGEEMSRIFAWMRPNDLVWNYWVNNYLLGNPPPAFDVLYWNSDTTRLPAGFHSDLLDVFGEELLRKPGAQSILGESIDLSVVDVDKFVVAGVTDHITPWKGVFQSTGLFGGSTEFVLSSSGHIQSLINPPGSPRAKYYLGGSPIGSPDAWLASAGEHSGSWWGHWAAWLADRSGEKKPAPPMLGNEQYGPTAAAPGEYVLEP
jgi:polyhydroxyalkanoate synthase subunit PhaC